MTDNQQKKIMVLGNLHLDTIDKVILPAGEELNENSMDVSLVEVMNTTDLRDKLLGASSKGVSAIVLSEDACRGTSRDGLNTARRIIGAGNGNPKSVLPPILLLTSYRMVLEETGYVTKSISIPRFVRFYGMTRSAGYRLDVMYTGTYRQVFDSGRTRPLLRYCDAIAGWGHVCGTDFFEILRRMIDRDFMGDGLFCISPMSRKDPSVSEKFWKNLDAQRPADFKPGTADRKLRYISEVRQYIP
jgi:hypothetical protein